MHCEGLHIQNLTISSLHAAGPLGIPPNSPTGQSPLKKNVRLLLAAKSFAYSIQGIFTTSKCCNSPSFSKMDGSALENSSSMTSFMTSSLPYLGITNVLRNALQRSIEGFYQCSIQMGKLFSGHLACFYIPNYCYLIASEM